MMQLYRASDALVGRQQEIEQHLFNRVTDLFGLQTTVTLYDLTNTYFEGEAAAQDLAKHGHSKEKRSDCPLLTLALVLDGSGFVRRSEVLAGNVKEQKVLAAAEASGGARRCLIAGLRGCHRGESEVDGPLPLSGGEP